MESKQSYRILLLADICNNHTIRLIRNLHWINPSARIDVFYHRQDKPLQEDIKSIVENFYTIPSSKKNTPSAIQPFMTIKSIIKVFKQIIREGRYDVVNIHFPLYYYAFIMKYIRKMTNTILVTPWGSDVYRVDGIKLKLVKSVYDKADYVCGAGNRFNEDVKTIFNVPKGKFVCLDIGSDTIDYISEHMESISRDSAKEKLGISDSYVIACGYNAAPAQNHKQMIEAINKARPFLPHKLTVLIPMTYLGTEEYRNSVKSLLDESSLNYIIFDKFLSMEDLFLIRRACDMFIHVQTTDANCASLQEFVLCGAKVLNGSWLRYKELEINDEVPYYLVPKIEDLADSIVNAYNDCNSITSIEALAYIESYGWKKWIVKWDDFYKRHKEI